MYKIVVLFAVSIMLGSSTVADIYAQKFQGNDIVGIWFRDQVHDTSKAKFEIYRASNGTYEGKLIWSANPTFETGLDQRNPDAGLRIRPVKNLLCLTGFMFDGDDEWSGGRIYSAEEGATYKCKIELEENKQVLKVRGYIGVPLLGRTERWRRVK